MSEAQQHSRATVAVVGGGLAGLSAAVAAAKCGLAVELFEARNECGGRAALTVKNGLDSRTDFCRHLALGCCTNWRDLLSQCSCDDLLMPLDDRHWFAAADGRTVLFRPARWPAPFHLLPAIFNRSDLGWSARLRCATALLQLARSKDDDSKSFDSWLRHCKQPDDAVASFWSPIVISALGDDIDAVSFASARKVFVDGLFASREAGGIIVPRMPMSEVIDRIILRAASLGAVIRLKQRIVSVVIEPKGVVIRTLSRQQRFDYVICAVHWHDLGSINLVDESTTAAAARWAELRTTAATVQTGAIAVVHLVYEKAWPCPPHAVLLGGPGQWFFANCPNCSNRQFGSEQSSKPHGLSAPFNNTGPDNNKRMFACQVVISGAHRLAEDKDSILIRNVRQQLSRNWPQENDGHLLYARVVRHHRAVFIPTPGALRNRPATDFLKGRIFLAGDWTATGWPATMEGAVRSGRLAVEAILAHLGKPRRLMTADLARDWPAGRLIATHPGG